MEELANNVRLRDITEEDLVLFFEQQLDPTANHMAAFTAKDPQDRETYFSNWTKRLGDTSIHKQTILFQESVAGHLSSFEFLGLPTVGYWLGKEFWGKGIATRALSLFVKQLPTRPLYARVAKDNIGSTRVLQKCGFEIVGEDKGFSHFRDEEVEEYILVLKETPTIPSPAGFVTAVSRSATHSFSKQNQSSIQLLDGLGVEGDAHLGETVKHRSRVAQNPNQPNLRQVHLIHAELHEELQSAGFDVSSGQMGENITTRGIPLLELPTGTRLHLGDSAVVELTGLRNPCQQLNQFQPGLMDAVLDRDPDGNLIRKAGVMGIVTASGEVKPGDPIRVEYPPLPHRPLERV